MPRMSKEERAELEARLRDDDDDEDDDPVTATFADGFSLTGSFRRISEAAAARGVKLKPDPAPDKDAPKDTNVKRFNSGRRTG